MYDFILDPWNPKTTGYLLQENGLAKSTDLDQAVPTWTQVISDSAIEAAHGLNNFIAPYKVIASINFEDYVGFAYVLDHDGNTLRLGYSFSRNAGSTWAHETIKGLSGGTTKAIFYRGALDYVPDGDISGDVILYAAATFTSLGGAENTEVHKATDGGTTWAQQSARTPHESSTNNLHCPYDGQDGGLLYWSSSVNTYKSTDDGVTNTAVVPTAGAIAFATRHGIGTWTEDKNQVVFWDEISFTLFVSTNGGTTWTAKSATGVIGDDICAAGGFPYNGSQYYLVTNKGVYLSLDGGDTFSDKTGNIDKTGDELDGLTNAGDRRFRCVIVPDWTE